MQEAIPQFDIPAGRSEKIKAETRAPVMIKTIAIVKVNGA
jgi:hypothetical protein